MLKTLAFANIHEGDSASFVFEITGKTVQDFAKFSGDTNPLHVDNDYAETTTFGHTLPHGMIAGALFSRLIGMELPGRFALYLSQSLAFRQPLPFAEVTVTGTVTQKTEAGNLIRIETKITNNEGDILVGGEALVRVLS